MTLGITGTIESGYENVAEKFSQTFRDSPNMGAALSVRVEGETVLDVWGGYADPYTDTPWSEDTSSVIFSSTKGLLAILACILTEERQLDFDSPVVRYWPEFGKSGKSEITIRQLLSHQAGLSAPREDLSFDDVLDWEAVVQCLERQEPLWEIGTGHSYHALTFGWLVGEVIRRITGSSVGEYFRERIASPLGVEAWIGVPESRLASVAHLSNSEVREELAASRLEAIRDGDPDWYGRSLTLGGAFPFTLVTRDGGFNDSRAQLAEIPGAGGVATARALATIWSSVVTRTEGKRLLSDDLISGATQVQSEGVQVFAGPPPYLRWGTGFQIDSPPARKYLSSVSFGHDGSGGQVTFADPVFKVGFCFLTNSLGVAGDWRASSVIEELRRSLLTKNG